MALLVIEQNLLYIGWRNVSTSVVSYVENNTLLLRHLGLIIKSLSTHEYLVKYRRLKNINRESLIMSEGLELHKEVIELQSLANYLQACHEHRALLSGVQLIRLNKDML